MTINTDAMRAWVDAYYPNGNHLTLQYRLALAEVDRLRSVVGVAISEAEGWNDDLASRLRAALDADA